MMMKQTRQQIKQEAYYRILREQMKTGVQVNKRRKKEETEHDSSTATTFTPTFQLVVILILIHIHLVSSTKACTRSACSIFLPSSHRHRCTQSFSLPLLDQFRPDQTTSITQRSRPHWSSTPLRCCCSTAAKACLFARGA